MAEVFIVTVTSKSPEARKLTTDVLKSETSIGTGPTIGWIGRSNGQLQGIPHACTSGGHVSCVIPAISCITSLQISAYEHEPTLNPCTIVHLIGKAKPATVLIMLIADGSLPVIGLRVSALRSITVLPGCNIGFK